MQVEPAGIGAGVGRDLDNLIMRRLSIHADKRIGRGTSAGHFGHRACFFVVSRKYLSEIAPQIKFRSASSNTAT